MREYLSLVILVAGLILIATLMTVTLERVAADNRACLARGLEPYHVYVHVLCRDPKTNQIYGQER